MKQKITFFIMTMFLAFMANDTFGQCFPTGPSPVFGTFVGATGTQTYNNMPTGNVVQITAPAAGTFYVISMCQTNGGVAQADGVNDSQLTLIDVNSAAAVELAFNDDFCPTTGANGFGPSQVSFTSTAAGDFFVYLTEWDLTGNSDCIDDGLTTSYTMTITASTTVPACEAGNVITAGFPLDHCPGTGFTITTDGTETTPSTFNAVFFPLAGATGGANGGDAFSLQVMFPFNTDEDLNGILSGNGFPAMSGSWSIFSGASDNNGICDLSPDSIIVNFLNGTDPICNANPGSPCTTATNFYGDLNDAGNGAPCDPGTGCITVSTQWDTLANPIGIFGSEAYILDGVQAGFDYVFDMCTGFGAGSWIPAITIISPGGNIDAFNLGTTGNFAQNCSLTWTASESGQYTIVIHEQGMACGVETFVDNGTPTVTCGANAASCAACVAGTLISPANIVVCGTEQDSIVLDGSESTPGSYTVDFSDAQGGTGGAVGGFVVVDVLSFPFVFNNDLNGVLSQNMLPPLSGLWELTVFNANLDGTLCDSVLTTITVNFVDQNDPLCNMVSNCAINMVDATTQSACDINTNTYSQDIVVSYTNPPATGTLLVNGQSFAITTSPQTVSLSNLPSNGTDVNIVASFSAENTCSLTQVAGFTAPVSCACPTINININTTDNTDCVNPNGSATAVASGGTAPYIYTWVPANAGAGATINNLNSGTYTVTATDLNGCTGMATANINNTVGLNALVGNISDISCFGVNDGSITINTSGATAPVSYNWSDQGFPSSVSTRNNLTAGSYSIVVTDASNCVVNLGPVVLNEPDLLTIVLENVSNVDCNGNSSGLIDVTVSGGNGNNVYSWTNGGGSLEDASNLSAGNYVLTVTDVNMCSATSNLIEVTEPATSLSVNGSSTPISSDGSVAGTATATVQGGTAPYTYLWSNGETTSSISVSDADTYTCTVTDANSCTETVSVEVELNVESSINALGLENLNIYPNPANDIVNITFSSKGSQDYSIQIFNTIGQRVLSKTYENVMGRFNNQISLGELSNGIYFIEIGNKDAKSAYKISINK